MVWVVSYRVKHKKNIRFVTFKSREGAEKFSRESGDFNYRVSLAIYETEVEPESVVTRFDW